MAHYDEIRRKSVVNSCLSPRKANKNNGLLVQGFHRREILNVRYSLFYIYISHIFAHIRVFFMHFSQFYTVLRVEYHHWRGVWCSGVV